MDRIKKLIIFLLLASMLFGNLPIQADTVDSLVQEKLAVSLVIDTSGSMANTDPLKLRETAANIFIDLLSPEDNLGVITFSTNTVEVIPMQQVASAANKNTIKSTLAPLLEADGDTNYQIALQAASNQLSSFTEPDVRKVIVFLTDGVPDPDPAKSKDQQFMNNYMNNMWATVTEIGLKQYPIYSVGFGAVNQDILNRISRDTSGEARFINDPGELAVSFFNVLSILKNRKNFIQTNVELVGEHIIEFDYDRYTSQVTMVFANANPGLQVSLTSQDGKLINENVLIQQTERYTLVTLNQLQQELTGKWTVKLNGTGPVRAFGDKDQFIKAWVTKPAANTQQPVNEPLEISVGITEVLSDNAIVEALIIKNGTPELNSIRLSEYEGSYVGVYDKTDVQGSYEIAITVKEDEELVTSTSSKVTIRELPVLKSDFYADNAIYKIGSASTVTGFLEIRGNKVTSNQDLSIATFVLYLKHADGSEERLNLVDNEDPAFGDIKGGDATFSSKVAFAHEGLTSASLIVQGLYKGENFIIERELGSYEEVQPGQISAVINSTEVYGVQATRMTIPVKIINTSKARETIEFSVDQSIGSIEGGKLVLEPGTTSEKMIVLNLNSALETDIYDVSFNLTCDDPLTVLESSSVPFKLEVITKNQERFRSIKKNLALFLVLAGLLFGLPLLVILFGLFLYSILVKPNIVVTGMLLYHKSDEVLGDGTVKELPIKSKRKSKIIVSFDENQPVSDFIISGTRYKYDIVLENEYEQGKRKFIDGYKALTRKVNRPRFMLYTTQPGIFVFNNEVMTKKELSDKDAFETGGYIFQYYAEKHRSKDKQQGKDLLEGRV
jgi:Mg-chelatase subunit ChlD